MVKKTSNKNAKSSVFEIGRFSLVGVINTLLDFGIYNLLVLSVGLPLIPSNIVSTTSAMTFSFFANKTWVFGAKGGNVARQAILFLAVTAFGLYVIQNATIYFLVNIWTWPLDFGYALVEFLKLDGIFSREFVVANGAKALATALSLIWNYVLYKKVVFSEGKTVRV